MYLTKCLKQMRKKFNQLQQDGGLGDIDFIQLIQDYISKDMLDNLISSNDFDSYPGYAPGLYENPEITSIEKVSCSFNTIREISSDTILIQSEVSVQDIKTNSEIIVKSYMKLGLIRKLHISKSEI